MTSAAMTDVVAKYGIKLQVLTGPAKTGPATPLRGPQHGRGRWEKHYATVKDENGWEHYAWRLRLSYTADGAVCTYDTPWKAGTAHDPEKVALGDVLASLVSDSYFGDHDFESFCNELGYDTDSRRAYAQWEAVVAAAKQFNEWLSGTMLEDLQNAAQDY